MSRNESIIDRSIRVVVGLALLSLLVVFGPSAWVGWFGIIPLVTGLVGFCPLYKVLGFRTTAHD